MRKDGQRASDPQLQFVWETLDSPEKETPTVPEEAPKGTVEQRRVPRRRTLLIGSGALVLLVGATYGAVALSTQPHHATTGVAAMPLPSSLISSQGKISTPPTSPSSRPSTTPHKSQPAAATHGDTATAQSRTSATAPAAPAPSTAEPPAPPPTGDWLLNQTTGNTAVDSAGAHDGTAQNGWWANGDGCLFNGTNSQIYTDGPVLSTGSGKSFTVSAWVNMTSLPASDHIDETAVSQDAGEDSGFYLQYSQSANRWAFSRAANETANPIAYQALSASAPSLSTWTHLVGVYDAANDTQYLYVNGVAQGTATDPTPFASPGDLAIGRDVSGGQDADWFKGTIKKVEIFNAALGPTQVSSLS